MEVDIEEDENEPELTYPYKEMDPLNLCLLLLIQNLRMRSSIEHEVETVLASVHEVGESYTSLFLHEDSDGLLPADSESRPPMLNKENYVLWSSRLLRYAKSRPNGKLIHNSILNGPYVRRMIAEPGDGERDVNEIWLRVQQMMKGFDIGIQEKKAKNKHFPEKIASNLKFLNNLQPEWSRHVTIVHQTKDLHAADYTQLYDFLKYNQKEVDELKAERIAKIQDPLALMANSNNPYASPAPHQDQSPFNQNFLQ
uniref:Gag-Pol polyprotein n=1 Tax=Tanacetum cinerariifolium TaxID=118510 RepID=A0A699INM2_TANCI|nr:hypothetical protein [Tanacetum cinerariifolium]